jgi:hypothetical protein
MTLWGRIWELESTWKLAQNKAYQEQTLENSPFLYKKGTTVSVDQEWTYDETVSNSAITCIGWLWKKLFNLVSLCYIRRK